MAAKSSASSERHGQEFRYYLQENEISQIHPAAKRENIINDINQYRALACIYEEEAYRQRKKSPGEASSAPASVEA